jgi:VWFA-related protein
MDIYSINSMNSSDSIDSIRLSSEVAMFKLTHKTALYGAAGALGGSAAWAFVLSVSNAAGSGLLTEVMLGAISGIFIGGFIWSHESITGRRFREAAKRAGFGAAAGLLGGAAGAALGNTIFTALGNLAAEAGGFKASLGVALSVALGWAVLGSAVGLSGGVMVRSRERTLYGLAGGALGGLFGGFLFNELSATSPWSALAGLALLGMSIGAFISLVEDAFISAKVKVVKGRHINREFNLVKDLNIVGRDDRSDVCLSGAEGVGMKHAAIKRKNGGFSIEADEEGKAVYVNQKLTRSSRLSDGDVIRIGSILLLFSAVKKAAATAVVIAALCFSAFATIGQAETAGVPASAQITQFDLSGFPVVRAYVSVLDAGGKPVRGLTKENVKFRENDRPVVIDAMRMAGGESGKHEALNLAIVIDRSGSMAGEKIRRAKESVLRFISLMEPGDRASLFAFSDDVTALEPLTGSQNILRKAVLSIQAEGNTALYDAIGRGIESVQGLSGRKAVVVLTDGIANRGTLDIDQAISSGVKGYVSVYTIGLGNDVRAARLERIAQETGGTYFFTPSADGLAGIYDTISNRIRSEYVVTYLTGRREVYLRNVSLTLATGQSAARTYFQPESSLFGAGTGLPLWAFAVPFLSVAGLIVLSLRKMDQQYAMAHLSLVRGRGTKKDIDIGPAATIGRDERNALGLFKDSGISQYHAEVIKKNGQYVIEDKGTEAGTFVNRKRIKASQALEDGDVINVGQATIVFSEGNRRACPGCGELIRAGARFCAKCGAKAA